MYVVKKVFYSWRIIALLGLLLALIAMGGKYALDYKQYKVNLSTESNNLSQDKDSAKEIENMRNSLSETEQLKLKAAETARQQLDVLNEYKEKSISYNSDAYNRNIVYLHYYIDLSDNVYADETDRAIMAISLTKEYYTYVLSSNISDIVAEKLGNIEAKYIQELLYATSSGLEQTQFVVSVCGKDVEQAKKLAEYVNECIFDVASNFNTQIGKHKLNLVDTYATTIIDSSLLKSQNTLKDQEIALRTEIQTYTQEFNSVQKNIFDYITSDKDSIGNTIIEKPSLNIKYVVIGLAVGIVIGIVIICIRVLAQGKLDTEETLEKNYNLNILGDISIQRQSRCIIDKVLFSIFEKKKGDISQRIDYIVSVMKTICRKKEISRLLIVSTMKLDNKMLENLETVKSQLSKNDIELVCKFDILNDKIGIEAMEGVDDVILLERMDETVCNELEKEINICEIHGQNILGVILV